MPRLAATASSEASEQPAAGEGERRAHEQAGPQRGGVHAEVGLAEHEVQQQEPAEADDAGRDAQGAHVGPVVPLGRHARRVSTVAAAVVGRSAAGHRPNGRCGVPVRPMSTRPPGAHDRPRVPHRRPSERRAAHPAAHGRHRRRGRRDRPRRAPHRRGAPRPAGCDPPAPGRLPARPAPVARGAPPPRRTARPARRVAPPPAPRHRPHRVDHRGRRRTASGRVPAGTPT